MQFGQWAWFEFSGSSQNIASLHLYCKVGTWSHRTLQFPWNNQLSKHSMPWVFFKMQVGNLACHNMYQEKEGEVQALLFAWNSFAKWKGFQNSNCLSLLWKRWCSLMWQYLETVELIKNSWTKHHNITIYKLRLKRLWKGRKSIVISIIIGALGAIFTNIKKF